MTKSSDALINREGEEISSSARASVQMAAVLTSHSEMPARFPYLPNNKKTKKLRRTPKPPAATAYNRPLPSRNGISGIQKKEPQNFEALFQTTTLNYYPMPFSSRPVSAVFVP